MKLINFIDQLSAIIMYPVWHFLIWSDNQLFSLVQKDEYVRTTLMRIDQDLFLKQSPNQTLSDAISGSYPGFKDRCSYISDLSFPPQRKRYSDTQRGRYFAMGLYSFTHASLSVSRRFPWSRISWSFGSESHHTKFQTYAVIHNFSLREICQTPFVCLSLILFTDTFKGSPTLTSLVFALLQMIPLSFQN